MLKNKQKRAISTPTIIDAKTVNNLKIWISAFILQYINIGGHKSFTIKDLFGYSHWDWSSKKYPIQVLYYNWYQKYQKEYPNATSKELEEWSFAAAAQSCGYLISQACNEMTNYTFEKRKEFKTTRYTVV